MAKFTAWIHGIRVVSPVTPSGTRTLHHRYVRCDDPLSGGSILTLGGHAMYYLHDSRWSNRCYAPILRSKGLFILWSGECWIRSLIWKTEGDQILATMTRLDTQRVALGCGNLAHYLRHCTYGLHHEVTPVWPKALRRCSDGGRLLKQFAE